MSPTQTRRMDGELDALGRSAAADITGSQIAASPIDTLPAGTVVTVPRLFGDMVVTEFGIARLWGRTVRERGEELIRIAHPRFREDLQTTARKFWGE